VKTIFLLTPGFGPHGGLRVIVEWANRLALHHNVILRCLKREACTNFSLSPAVRVVYDDGLLREADLAIITSPHSAVYLDVKYPLKKVVFLQMMEHLFQPRSFQWEIKCRKLYTTKHPLICLSKWVANKLFDEYGRSGFIGIVGNGVNLSDFPVSTKPKDGFTILVEGWQSTNPTKDTNRIGPKVAAHFKDRGYRITAYSQLPLGQDEFAPVPHEYIQQPDLAALNRLYEQATVLVKATRYDCRSTSPMEAMTKGTVTARAVRQGDDDLIDLVNCVRCDYSEGDLIKKVGYLLENPLLREGLAETCRNHVQDYTWEYWMQIIEPMLWQ
jgi:hypothetical protein